MVAKYKLVDYVVASIKSYNGRYIVIFLRIWHFSI